MSTMRELSILRENFVGFIEHLESNRTNKKWTKSERAGIPKKIQSLQRMIDSIDSGKMVRGDHNGKGCWIV